jgi:hypothetical protein
VTSTFLCPHALADGISRHEQVKLTPIMKNGKSIGFRMNVVLRPEGKFSVAGIRIGQATVREQTLRAEGPLKMRYLAAGAQPGYLRFEFPELDQLAREPKELTYHVYYGVGNDLKPGDRVDIFSFWHAPGKARELTNGDSTHIFGFFGDQRSTFDLP